MFRTAREQCLKRSSWESGQLAYIEAWKYSDIDDNDAQSNFRHGYVAEQDLLAWLEQEGPFAPPKPPPKNAKLRGGFRLLVCQQTYWLPPGFSISKEAFLAVEKAFGLSPATLPAFYNNRGTMSRYKDIRTDEEEEISSIALVLKAPQKYQIANYGISLRYHFRTGFSNGLLYGSGLLKHDIEPQEDMEGQLDQLRTQLQDAISLWAHPLILPCVFLSVHLTRAQAFCARDLDERVLRSEDVLGVNRAGRLRLGGAVQDFTSRGPLHETKSSIPVLTTMMSTALTEIIFTATITDWQCECARWLLEKEEEMFQHLSADVRVESFRLREHLEHLETNAKTLASFVVALKERMDLQLGILYNFVAQIDNSLSAKMAASASRDSAAMKTLAFMATLFLPGTFVATMFSMSMFNWDALGSSIADRGNGVLSPYFWVYWAVTLPLTITVLVGWRLWWALEKRAFDRDVVTQIQATQQTKL